MSRFVIKPFTHSLQMTHGFAQKSLAQLMEAMIACTEQRANTVNFEDIYRTSYNLTLHKFGARVQFAIRHAIRALVTAHPGSNHATERSRCALMLSDINKYHQRTWVLNQRQEDVYAVLVSEMKRYEDEYKVRHARAVAVVDKYKQAWLQRFYSNQGGFVEKSKKEWCKSGLVYQKAEKRKREDDEEDGADEPAAKR